MSTRVQGLLIALAATLPFVGTFDYDFITYDDRSGIVDNSLIRELSIGGLPAFFEPTIAPGLLEYMPLKHLSYAVDYALFGLSAPGFRLQQQAWYLLAVLITWAWLRRLLLQLADGDRLGFERAWVGPLAMLGGLMFAVHPVHVESVVWLSGRKDLLCGAFMACTLWCALRYAGAEHRVRWLVLALGSCALALLSKPMAVVLPGLLIVQDLVLVEPSRRLHELRRRWPLHAGTLLLCLGFVALYLNVVGSGMAMEPGERWRLFSGPSALRWGQQLGGFLWLSLWPTALAPIYPPDLFDPRLLSARALLGLLLLLSTAGGLLWSLRRAGLSALGPGLLLCSLAPILATPPWGQYLSCRYLFHGVLGVIVMLLWAGARLATARPQWLRPLWAAGVGLLLTWGALSIAYAGAYESELALWRSAARAHPTFALAHERAARAAIDAGDKDEAAAWLDRCLEARPQHGNCAAMLGGLLWEMNPDAGERMLRDWLSRDATGSVHVALSFQLAGAGRGAEGLRVYENWLHGRAATSQELRQLLILSLAARDAGRALGHAKAMVQVMADTSPALPPPSELLQPVAELTLDPTEAASIHAALASCARVDCFRRLTGW